MIKLGFNELKYTLKNKNSLTSFYKYQSDSPGAKTFIQMSQNETKHDFLSFENITVRFPQKDTKDKKMESIPNGR